jgi:hypothetical protein
LILLPYKSPRFVANKLAAPNPAMTSLFQTWRHWRGIGEPER